VAAQLSSFFFPKSVAIIGASRNPEKVGAIVLKNIIESEFRGQIYPINLGSEVINGLKSYPDIKSLPKVPDLVVIAIPTQPALEILIEVGEFGVKNVVVYTAGFKEVGDNGKKLEAQLIEIATKYNLNLLGPNCFGFVNNLCPLNVTFGEIVNGVGNLRFISQSGALAASLLDWCKSQDLSFSEFVTLGNKAVLNENDFLTYFKNFMPPINNQANLSRLRPIGLYLESIVAGQEFLKITREITRTDPVFIIKPGKTEAAGAAMKSHTGAIAGSDAVLDEALKESGIIRCDTLEDFFDLSKAFSWSDIPAGPRVAIVSNAGGPSVISADAAVNEGLELAHLDDSTRAQLLEVLPRSASILNPVDVLGDALADRFAQACEIILKTNQVDSLVVVLTPQVMTQIEKTAEALGLLSEKYSQPIFCSFIGGSQVAEGEQILNKYHLPSFRFPERAINALAAMWRFKKRQLATLKEPGELVDVLFDTNPIKEIITAAVGSNHKTLDNLEADRVLSLAGIPTPKTGIVTTVEQAAAKAGEIGYPVVLKMSSPGLLHKKKVGGVITGIRDEDMLGNGWDTLQRKISFLEPDIQGHIKVQIQKEVASGIEIIVGIKRDPTFGPVMLFGAGGSYAELISDRNLQLLPLNLMAAKSLVERSKVYQLLKGSDYDAPYALERLYEVLVRLGKLAESLPVVTDIEINPVIVTLNDVWAVDGKVILENKPIVWPKFKVATTTYAKVLSAKYHYFELETEEVFNFVPGQYISVKVASDRINCYSIAGSHSPTKFNLLIDTTPGGPGSKFFEALQVGGKLSFLGPFGTFTLKPDDGSKQLLFLGTGCGFAPLKCMIEVALKANETALPIHLYLGFNYQADIFLKDYLEKLSLEYPNFKYKIVVSKPEASYRGLKGFITEYVAKDFKKARDCAAYLCGNKLMIAGVTEVLLKNGCPPKRIYTEKY